MPYRPNSRSFFVSLDVKVDKVCELLGIGRFEFTNLPVDTRLSILRDFQTQIDAMTDVEYNSFFAHGD